jgi:hypothetical protein
MSEKQQPKPDPKPDPEWPVAQSLTDLYETHSYDVEPIERAEYMKPLPGDDDSDE